MDDDRSTHSDHLYNPAGAAARTVGDRGSGRWWGVAALVTALVLLVSGVARLFTDGDPFSGGGGFLQRLSTVGLGLSAVPALLAIFSLLDDASPGRRLARWAMWAWLVAMVLMAINDQQQVSQVVESLS